MSKYILEIKPEYEANGIMILGARDSHLYVTTIEVKDLEELNSDYINEHFGDLQDTAYRKGRESVFHELEISGSQKGESAKEAYQRGFEDGKAVHEKGCEGCKYGGSLQGSSPCYNCSNYYENNWTAKDDKITVGDEVEWKDKDINNGRGLVLWIDDVAIGCRRKCDIMCTDGSAGTWDLNEFVKTGRHFDIQSILEAMKA